MYLLVGLFTLSNCRSRFQTCSSLSRPDARGGARRTTTGTSMRLCVHASMRERVFFHTNSFRMCIHLVCKVAGLSNMFTGTVTPRRTRRHGAGREAGQISITGWRACSVCNVLFTLLQSLYCSRVCPTSPRCDAGLLEVQQGSPARLPPHAWQNGVLKTLYNRIDRIDRMRFQF